MGSEKSENAAMTPRILVTGDLIRETHLYQGSRRFSSYAAASGFLVETTFGGAKLLHDLLESAEPGVSVLGLEVDANAVWPSHVDAHAVYGPFTAGFKSDPPPPPGKKPDKIWRVAEPLGYGASGDVPPIEPPVNRRDLGTVSPRVLLVDDGGAGFRTIRAKSRWPDAGDETTSLPPFVVLKMSQPLCEGHLWRQLLRKCDPKSGLATSELVVVISADELRRDGAAINRGLSWERTVSDTCETLTRNPRFAALRRAAHILVVFRREGVLWMRRVDRASTTVSETGRAPTLIFDPGMAEGQWKTTLNEERGEVFGQLSVFAAAIALELAQASDPGAKAGSFIEAIERGLRGARRLKLLGHGLVKKQTKPRFPNKELAEILRPPKGTQQDQAPLEPHDRFVAIALPPAEEFGQGGAVSPDWTIASLYDGPGGPIPLYGRGFQAAIYGPSRLWDVPHARFGDLFSVDRDEIETLRSLRQMIQAYELGGPQGQPLCIGAFGPPGAGKSFGIKQIAREILGRDVPLLEFNLSQMDDPEDLTGAFHQVRDKVLSGRTPVVFWDEFDSEEFKWLQFLLAPMQDGKFQSGPLTHTLGKCIFVFAGATSWDFEHFGPAPEPANEAEAAELKKLIVVNTEFATARQGAKAKFRLKKGPDFVSRLSGHINVHGPNRRLRFNFSSGQWDRPDLADITFPVRRALLLRAFLKAKERDVLDIDRDLLNALLRQPRYRHGARSMEKTVEPLRVQHAALRPAQLPPPQVLAQHLDPAGAFQSLLTENATFLTDENVRELAAAIHENFRYIYAKPGDYVADPQFRETFDSLDAWGQATNLAAARSIPHLLALAGLCVVMGPTTAEEENEVTRRVEQFMDALRREEHARWMSYMTSNGWLQAEETDAHGNLIRDNGRLLHTCLKPFDELSPHEQTKDEAAIRHLPKAVTMVRFKIVRFPEVAV